MARTNAETSIFVRLIRAWVAAHIANRKMTREKKKARGLKYCRYAGYGYRWFRGRRVPDEHEAAVIAKVVEWKQKGYSWYGIASHLLRNRIRTSDGREWSVARCRRAYAASVRRQAP